MYISVHVPLYRYIRFGVPEKGSRAAGIYFCGSGGGVKIAVLLYVIDNTNDSLRLLIFSLTRYCDILS